MRLSGLMFALASTVLASCVASTPLAAQDTIKIGSSNSMTGPNAFLGIASTRGAEMAIEAINAAGGIGGKKLEFIVRDDEHDPVKLVANYRQLVERDGVVAMIGGSNSASMLAVTPLVNDQLKVPVICPQTDATAITENDAWKEKRDNYMFRLAMYGHGQANFLVDSMVKKFGYKKVGLLTWTAGWGVTGRGELNRRLSELGLKPVADETYDTSDTDPTPQILKLRNAGAEVIINYGLVRENTFIAKTRVKLDDHTPYASAWGLAVPAFWTAAGNAAEGMLTSVTFTIDGPQPADRIAVINAYHKKYGPEFDAPLAFFHTYDAINLLATVMRKVGNSPDAIRAGLEDVQHWKGTVANFDRPVFTRDRHNALTEDDMILCRWTDGKMLQVMYDEVGPYVVPKEGEKKYINVKTLELK